jgi:hypothetical protein
MKIILTPSWELSNEHSQSCHGQPVLVNRASREVYGPADIVQAYRSWTFQPAADAVKRMAGNLKLTRGARSFVKAFIDFGKIQK